MFYDPKDELGDNVGRPQRARATNGRAAYLAAWTLLAALTLVSLYAVCATFGCGPLHVHIGGRYSCGQDLPTTQSSYVGSSRPDVILGAE